MDGSIRVPPVAERSDHFNGERFFNPYAPYRKTREDLRRWRRTRRRHPWPAHVEDPPFAPPSRAAPDRIAVTFIGHSTFLVQVGGIAVLIDPIWSQRCSPVAFAARAGRAGPDKAWTRCRR